MKFIHVSDLHLGAFSSFEKIHAIMIKNFMNMMDFAINENVDFIIISGDIFDSPYSMFNDLKNVVKKFREFIEKDKKIYTIPGSHDRKYSERTIYDILVASGIFTDVSRYENGRLIPTHDERTGFNLYGVGGLENSMDVEIIKKIEKVNDNNSIFLFHAALEGILQNVKSLKIWELPDGFSYYAGGHVHKRGILEKNGRPVVYPGIFFASTQDEIFNIQERGFALVEDFKIRFIDSELNVSKLNINVENKSMEEIIRETREGLENLNGESIVLINYFGKYNGNFQMNLTTIPLSLRRKFPGIFIRERDVESHKKEITLEENDSFNVENPFVFDVKSFMETLKMEREQNEKSSDYTERLKKETEKFLKAVINHDNKKH